MSFSTSSGTSEEAAFFRSTTPTFAVCEYKSKSPTHKPMDTQCLATKYDNDTTESGRIPIPTEEGTEETNHRRKGLGKRILKATKNRNRRRRRESKSIVNISKNSTYFKVFHTNCRGVESKLMSIEAIVANIVPNVITMNEVNL